MCYIKCPDTLERTLPPSRMFCICLFCCEPQVCWDGVLCLFWLVHYLSDIQPWRRRKMHHMWQDWRQSLRWRQVLLRESLLLMCDAVHFHLSGMRNEFVTFCFLFFVQSVRIRQPFLPPAPREIPKGSCIVYMVLHTSGMRKKTDEFLLCLGDFSVACTGLVYERLHGSPQNGTFPFSSTAHLTSFRVSTARKWPISTLPPPYCDFPYLTRACLHLLFPSLISQVCWRLFVFLCMYKWKLKSAATAGMILLPLPMHFCLENMHFCQRRAQVCWRLFVFLCMYKWKLKSAATAGIILLPLPMHFCHSHVSHFAQLWVDWCAH